MTEETTIVLPEVPPNPDTLDSKQRIDYVQLCRLALQQGVKVSDEHLNASIACLQKIRSTSSSAGKKDSKPGKAAAMTLDDV